MYRITFVSAPRPHSGALQYAFNHDSNKRACQDQIVSEPLRQPPDRFRHPSAATMVEPTGDTRGHAVAHLGKYGAGVAYPIEMAL